MNTLTERQISSEELYKAASMTVGAPDKIVKGVHIHIGKTKADINSKEAKAWFEEKADLFRQVPLLIQETEDKDALSVELLTNPSTLPDLPMYEIEGLRVFTTQTLYETRLLEVRFCALANLCGGFNVNPGDGMLKELTPDCWTMEPWTDAYNLNCSRELICEALAAI